jgi:hypothetical protein
MFAAIWSALRRSPTPLRRPSLPPKRRPCLEVLEDRNLLSGGAGTSSVSVSGSDPSQVAIVTQTSSASGSGQTSGGSGSGLVGISGPGYPLAPGSGPTRTDPGTLSQTSGGSVLVGITGTSGGSGPTLAVVPVCTGTSPGTGTAG